MHLQKDYHCQSSSCIRKIKNAKCVFGDTSIPCFFIISGLSSLPDGRDPSACTGCPVSQGPLYMCACGRAQFGLTHCDPTDYRLPGFSIHEIFQARILEWVAISFSGGSSQPRDCIHVFCISCLAGVFFAS